MIDLEGVEFQANFPLLADNRMKECLLTTITLCLVAFNNHNVSVTEEAKTYTTVVKWELFPW